MIFKTFNNDLDGIANKIGFSSRSFSEWGNQVSQAFNNAGKGLNGFKSAFYTAFNSTSASSSNNISLIKQSDFSTVFNTKNAESFFHNFNVNGSKSLSIMTRWCDGLKVTDKTMKAYLSECMQNQVPASFEGYNRYVQSAIASNKQFSLSAKLATTATNTLKLALNAISFMAIVKGVQFLVDKIFELANAEKLASENANELYNKSNELVQQNKEEAKSLSQLISKYKELKDNGDLDLDTRKEIKEIQNDIAELVGTQANNLDLVNGKLDEELEKLNKISEEEAKRALQNAEANYYNAKDASDKAIGSSKVFFEDYDYSGKVETEAKKILEEAGFGVYNSNGHLTAPTKGGFGQDGIMGSKMVVKAVGDSAKEKYDYLQQLITVLEENGQKNTDIYKGLITQAAEYDTYLDNEQTAATDLVDAWINYNQISNENLKNINVNSVESFEKYRQKMIKELQSDESIGEMISDGLLSKDDLETSVNDFMSTASQFSDWYKQWKGEISDSDIDIDTKKITSISEALAQSNGTEDGTWADDIEDYKEKLSSLQSYLEKFRDGSYTPEDLLTLADKFNIVGDTAEERISKISALIQEETRKAVAIIDNIISAGNLDDATIAGLNEYKNLLQDIADIDLNGNVNFDLSGNALEDVQSLSQGLDQLDKIYADILDKEDFDWSSILNNDGFKEQFGAYTEEYENFINTVSKSPDDINACQDAFNKLASAYLYGTGVLDGVTEATKAGTIAMLKQMGVANAAAIVEQALIENEKMLAAQKYAAAKGCRDLADATYEEIHALIKEGDASEETRKCLEKLALEKWNVQKIEINTKSDIDNIIAMANAAGASADQIARLKTAMSSLNTLDTGISDTFTKTPEVGLTGEGGYDEALKFMAGNNPAVKDSAAYKKMVSDQAMRTQESVMNEVRDLMKDIQDSAFEKLDPKDFYPEVNYTGGTTTKDTREKLAKEAEKAAKDAEKAAEEVAEPIDFIDIKLNNLIDSLEKTKDKISDLLSFGSKKKQTQKAIEATTKALEAEYKAMKRYAEYAKKFSLDAAKETTETVTESVSGAVSDAVSSAVSSTASDVVAEAMKYVGVLDYVWGGESLTKGADCSGFVQQVYRKLGMEIPRNTTGQYGDSNSISVSKADLQPGDLVFFQGSLGSPGNPRHVGIYAGNGQFIDSPTTGKKVQITSLSSRSDYIGAKRYAGASSAPVTYSPSSDISSTTTYTKTVPGIPQKTLEKYWKLVREGSFDVETITNEKLKNAIKSYQEWYEKMKSCRDKIEELNNTLRELYQTMAEIPIEKRDKNVETLETRLDIINSKRDNINAVIVDPKKYASTQKTLKQSKASVKKGIKTKAQRNATGLSKTEIDTIKSQMKKGQTIPAKILDKITNGAFYEQCKQYNDAVYEHSQYAKSIRTAGDSIKKFNTISDQILDAEKSKTKQYKTAYNTTSKSYAKSLDNVKSKGAQTKKAFGSKKFGLTNADIKRINSCIKSCKQIPTDLMVQLQSQSIFDSCVEYNKAVMENEILREKLDETRFDLQKQQQAETAARLEVKTEKHQNIADKASAKMERNDALAENAEAPKKKNAYLGKNLDLLQTEYKHLIKIAELENDSVKAAKLRAELEKETADIIEQQFQNISDYYSARRDKISDKESLQDLRYENAQVDVKKKNDILNIKTRFATETNAESEQEYTDTAKLFNTNRTDAKKAANKVKKLSSSDKSKILKLMESKEEIPENLMDKVAKLDPDAYQKLLNYNDSLDWLEKATLNKKISNEELIKTKRENEIQKHQNIADRAQDKIDKNDALSNISTTASEQNKYEKENIKYLNTQYKHLLEIAKLHEDDVEYARLEAELQSKIAESYKAMFDNVQTEFENKISLINNDISDLDNEIKKVEASGRLIDASYYNYKISMENETLEKLKEEESSLVEQLKNVKMFSPAWYECQDAIQSVQNAQADAISSIKEYKDAINEIANTIQNDIVDAFHDITDEAELLITLLGDNLSDSDIGGLTEDGLAVLSLYVSQMNVCQKAAESFHKEIKSMQDALDNNTLSFIDANGIQRDYASIFELKKHIKDFYSSYQDEIKHVYDYEAKVVDMMIKKYQSELDYLKILIEQKQKALDAEKDLYEYSKNIQKQTDNINSLRKQIAALQGDTSKETESRIQKLQSQLKDATESLESDEYERYISDQKDMLSNLYDEYAKLVEDVMNDHDKLLKEALDLFAQTGADVQDVIRAVADEYNYEITGEMEKIISSIEGMGSLDTYLGVGGTITQSLGDIVNEVHNAYIGLSSDMQGMKDAVASIGYQGKYDTSDVDHTDNYIHDNTDIGNSSNTNLGSNSDTSAGKNDSGKDFESLIDNLLRNGTNTYDPKTTSSLNRYIYSKYGSALTVDEMAKLSEYLGFNYTPAQLAKDDKNHSKRKMKMLDELKVHGFSNGGIVPDDALKVRDIGIKPASNGDDRLVALKPKESVFNEKQTKMIQEYVNKGPDLNSIKNIVPIMDKMMKMPEVEKKEIPTQNIMQIGDVSFNLPNVYDYADLMNEAKNDPKFEEMIARIMKHQLGFGSYLKKTNVNFRH